MSRIQFSSFLASLLLIILLVFRQVLHHEFVYFDDRDYVTENAHVRSGLSWATVGWAFRSLDAGNWHPLTWLSHLLDVELFGLRPGAHHLVSVGLHAANAALLFTLLSRLTGAGGASAIVAVLFAVHPLHVESVAWVAERKDLLSAFFWFLTMYAYLQFCRQPTAGRYAMTVASFAAGLMAKPVLVTLPVILILMDCWPLGRLALPWETRRPWTAVARHLREKGPLLALAMASGAITLIAQSRAKALALLEDVSLPLRIFNAAVSSARYLAGVFWPKGLAFFYPLFTDPPTLPGFLLSASLLLFVTALAATLARRRPWLFFGWLWFIVSLAPMSGLVQVGEQARADRYTYLPLVGIFLMLAWSLLELTGGRRRLRFGVVVFLTIALAVLMRLSFLQVRTWRDSHALLDRAISVTKNNYQAYGDRGSLLLRQGRVDEAIQDLQRAIRARPVFADAHYNLGIAQLAKGDNPAAEGSFRRVLELVPGDHEARLNLALALMRMGRLQEAGSYFREVLHMRPESAEARQGLAQLRELTGRSF